MSESVIRSPIELSAGQLKRPIENGVTENLLSFCRKWSIKDPIMRIVELFAFTLYFLNSVPAEQNI